MKYFYAIAIALLLIPSTSISQDTCNGNWLTTEGNKLKDASGNTVRLTGVNWFGFETETNFPHSLWGVRDHRSMLQQIKDLGFNTIRVPWHNGMLRNGASLNVVGGGTDPYTGANPMNEIESTFSQPIQLLDFMIEWCQENDMKVVLDCHSRNPDAFIEELLWYTDNVSEEQWIEDWVFLADRYKEFDAVIGMDINNEPHGSITDTNGARWGSNNNSNDWRLAAQRCGNAILEANPNVLIIVEGVQAYQKPNGEQTNYWWGGNLQGARDFPVVLSNPSKLMYSPHEYGPTVSEQPWFEDPNFPDNMEGIWEEQFNFLNTNNESPLLVGEFGIRDQGSLDEIWFEEFTDYIIEKGLSYTYWCMNPNSADTGGILADDWITVNQWKMDYLIPTLFETIPNCMPAQEMCQLNISCVEDMTITLLANSCTATINLEAPTTSSCQSESLTNNAPSEFPLGLTVVTWTLSGDTNEITCTQNIMVIDQITPEINCLEDIDVVIDQNTSYTLPNYTTDISVIDNCDDSNLTVTQTPEAGTNLAIGSFPVSINVTDASGNSNECSFNLTIDTVLSVDDVIDNSNNISLYPNPVGDILTIEQSQALPLQIDIYDLRGRKVISTSLNATSSPQTIDVSHLNTALYIVTIQSDTNVVSRKIIVNY